MSDGAEARLEAVLRRHRPRHSTAPGARPAAVLVPIVGWPRPALIFTVRTETVRAHKGQISFPGGAVDPRDASPEAAALREAREELGLDERAARILGRLDAIATFVSGYVVTPVVAWLDEPPRLAPNPAEVARVLHVPIAQLVDDIRAEAGFSHRGRSFPTEAWIWNGEVIWGVTARILRTLLQRLAEAGIARRPGGPAAARSRSR